MRYKEFFRNKQARAVQETLNFKIRLLAVPNRGSRWYVIKGTDGPNRFEPDPLATLAIPATPRAA